MPRKDSTTNGQQRIYTMITDRILAKLDEGYAPWRIPWAKGLPKNLHSGRPYRGINVLMTSLAPYQANWWITFKQAKERGGHIRKGEQGTPIVFWKWNKVADPDRTVTDPQTGQEHPVTKNIPFMRYYTVFNVEQCDGLEYPQPAPADMAPIDAAQRIINKMPNAPRIINNNIRACYNPITDLVQCPTIDKFDHKEQYYSTMFHELAHSTGHRSRLARPEITKLTTFGNYNYGIEELVAELTASMLCGVCRIDTDQIIETSAAYLDHWRGVIKENKRMIVHAAQRAQKAADYILDTEPDNESE